MKYRNKLTGTIVEPPDERAAQTFERSSLWRKIREKINPGEKGREGK